MNATTADCYALLVEQSEKIRAIVEIARNALEMTQYCLDKLAGIEAELAEMNTMKAQDAVDAAWRGLHGEGNDID